MVMDGIKPQYDFSPEKNHWLIRERGISFEDVITALSNGQLLNVIEHNQKKYAKQRIYIINIDDYVYMVPFVKNNEQTIFLKTIFPSRKLTKKYLGGSNEKNKT
jgi:hypothetical protein